MAKLTPVYRRPNTERKGIYDDYMRSKGLNPDEVELLTDDELEDYLAEDISKFESFTTGLGEHAGAGLGGAVGAIGAGLALTGAGAIVGVPLMIGGGLLGAYGGSKIQEGIEGAVYDDDELRQLQQDRMEARLANPLSSFAGQVAPSLVAFRPDPRLLKSTFSGIGKVANPKPLTQVETAALLQSGIGGGVEAGIEGAGQIARGDFDAGRLAGAFGVGTLLQKPTFKTKAIDDLIKRRESAAIARGKDPSKIFNIYREPLPSPTEAAVNIRNTTYIPKRGIGDEAIVGTEGTHVGTVEDRLTPTPYDVAATIEREITGGVGFLDPTVPGPAAQSMGRVSGIGAVPMTAEEAARGYGVAPSELSDIYTGTEKAFQRATKDLDRLQPELDAARGRLKELNENPSSRKDVIEKAQSKFTELQEKVNEATAIIEGTPSQLANDVGKIKSLFSKRAKKIEDVDPATGKPRTRTAIELDLSASRRLVDRNGEPLDQNLDVWRLPGSGLYEVYGQGADLTGSPIFLNANGSMQIAKPGGRLVVKKDPVTGEDIQVRETVLGPFVKPEVAKKVRQQYLDHIEGTRKNAEREIELIRQEEASRAAAIDKLYPKPKPKELKPLDEDVLIELAKLAAVRGFNITEAIRRGIYRRTWDGRLVRQAGFAAYDTRNITFDPRTATDDTIGHEGFHNFMDDLQYSTNKKDRKLHEDYLKLFKEDAITLSDQEIKARAEERGVEFLGRALTQRLKTRKATGNQQKLRRLVREAKLRWMHKFGMRFSAKNLKDFMLIKYETDDPFLYNSDFIDGFAAKRMGKERPTDPAEARAWYAERQKILNDVTAGNPIPAAAIGGVGSRDPWADLKFQEAKERFNRSGKRVVSDEEGLDLMAQMKKTLEREQGMKFDKPATGAPVQRIMQGIRQESGDLKFQEAKGVRPTPENLIDIKTFNRVGENPAYSPKDHDLEFSPKGTSLLYHVTTPEGLEGIRSRGFDPNQSADLIDGDVGTTTHARIFTSVTKYQSDAIVRDIQRMNSFKTNKDVYDYFRSRIIPAEAASLEENIAKNFLIHDAAKESPQELYLELGGRYHESLKPVVQADALNERLGGKADYKALTESKEPLPAEYPYADLRSKFIGKNPVQVKFDSGIDVRRGGEGNTSWGESVSPQAIEAGRVFTGRDLTEYAGGFSDFSATKYQAARGERTVTESPFKEVRDSARYNAENFDKVQTGLEYFDAERAVMRGQIFGLSRLIQAETDQLILRPFEGLKNDEIADSTKRMALYARDAHNRLEMAEKRYVNMFVEPLLMRFRSMHLSKQEIQDLGTYRILRRLVKKFGNDSTITKPYADKYQKLEADIKSNRKLADANETLDKLYRETRAEQVANGPRIKVGNKYVRVEETQGDYYDPYMLSHDNNTLLRTKAHTKEGEELQEKILAFWLKQRQQQEGVKAGQEAELRDELAEYIAVISNKDSFVTTTGENRPLTTASKFGALRKGEGLLMPPDLVDADPFMRAQRYIGRFSKDMAWHTQIEGDEVMRAIRDLPDDANVPTHRTPESEGSDKMLTPTLKEIFGDDVDAGYLARAQGTFKNLDEVHTGFHRRGDLSILRLNRLITSQWLGTLSGVRDFVNSFKNANMYMRTEDWPLVLKSLTHFQDAWKQSHISGANRSKLSRLEFAHDSVDRASDAMATVADLSQKYSGRELFERGTRAIQFNLGKLLMRSYLNSGTPDAHVKRMLNLMGRMGDVDTARLAKNPETTTEADLNKLATAWVEINQGTYGARGVPSWSIRGPSSWFTSLSRWSIEKYNRYLKDVVMPMTKGDPATGKKDFKPFLKSTLGSVVEANVLMELTEMINAKENYEPTTAELLESNAGFEDYVYHAMHMANMSGYFGLLSGLSNDAVRMIRTGKAAPEGLSFITFPGFEALLADKGLLQTSVAYLNSGRETATTMRFIEDIITNLNQTLRIARNQVIASSSLSKDIDRALGTTYVRTRASEADRKVYERDLRIFNRLNKGEYSTGWFQNLNRYETTPKSTYQYAQTEEEMRDTLQDFMQSSWDRAQTKDSFTKEKILDRERFKSLLQKGYQKPKRISPRITKDPQSLRESAAFVDFINRLRGKDAVRNVINQEIADEVLAERRKQLLAENLPNFLASKGY